MGSLKAEVRFGVVTGCDGGLCESIVVACKLTQLMAVQINRLEEPPGFVSFYLVRIEVVVKRWCFPFLTVPVESHITLCPDFFGQCVKPGLIGA